MRSRPDILGESLPSYYLWYCSYWARRVGAVSIPKFGKWKRRSYTMKREMLKKRNSLYFLLAHFPLLTSVPAQWSVTPALVKVPQQKQNSWEVFRGSCLCPFPEPSFSIREGHILVTFCQYKVGLRVPLPSWLLETLLPLPPGTLPSSTLAALCCWQRESCCSAGQGARLGHWGGHDWDWDGDTPVLREAKQGKVTKTRLVWRYCLCFTSWYWYCL